MRLADKVAIVTGGAAGLGFAYARRFLAEGARVVVADVVDPGPAADTLGAAAGRVLGVRIDVSDAGAARAMVQAAVARFGRVDVLVNNAAVFATLKPRAFDEIPEAEWDRVMAVNVTGIWNCVRAVAPVMRAVMPAPRFVVLGSAATLFETATTHNVITAPSIRNAFSRSCPKSMGLSS